MARNRLVARDRMLMFGLAFGLLVGVGIGRKILSPVMVVLFVGTVFACAYFALRLTRDARDGSAHRHLAYEGEEYVEA